MGKPAMDQSQPEPTRANPQSQSCVETITLHALVEAPFNAIERSPQEPSAWVWVAFFNGHAERVPAALVL